MAVTYTQAEEALASIRGDIITARKVFADGKTRVVQADNVLGNLATTYSEVIAAIDAAPVDDAYDVLKARKAKMVIEFTALKADTAVARTALGL